MSQDIQRVLTKGGVLSPGELKQVIALAEASGQKEILFGSRQDILIPSGKEDENPLESFPDLSLDVVSERDFQNIVCSYVSADIFKNTPWLNGVKYLYVLEEFKYIPKLKINITDPKQQLVPLFSGQLNFVASEHEDYWYLILKLPNWEESVTYPVLIFSYDIAKISQEIEAIAPDADDVEELFDLVKCQFGNQQPKYRKRIVRHLRTFSLLRRNESNWRQPLLAWFVLEKQPIRLEVFKSLFGLLFES